MIWSMTKWNSLYDRLLSKIFENKKIFFSNDGIRWPIFFYLHYICSIEQKGLCLVEHITTCAQKKRGFEKGKRTSALGWRIGNHIDARFKRKQVPKQVDGTYLVIRFLSTGRVSIKFATSQQVCLQGDKKLLNLPPVFNLCF